MLLELQLKLHEALGILSICTLDPILLPIRCQVFRSLHLGIGRLPSSLIQPIEIVRNIVSVVIEIFGGTQREKS